MSDEAPKPTLDDSLARLRNLDEFHVVCEFLQEERESALVSMYDAPDANQAMKLAGIVSGYQNILSLLRE
jgi:hypothetical protein